MLHYDRMASTVHWFEYLISSIDQDTELYRFEKDRPEFSDEVEAFRQLTIKAAEEATKLSDLIAVTLEAETRQRLVGTAQSYKLNAEGVKRLERLSIKMQCLLSAMPGCPLL